MICWYITEVTIYPVYAVYMVYMPYLAGKARQRIIDHIQCIIRLQRITRRIIRISDRKSRYMPALPRSGQRPAACTSSPLTEEEAVQSANLCFQCSKLQWHTLQLAALMLCEDFQKRFDIHMPMICKRTGQDLCIELQQNSAILHVASLIHTARAWTLQACRQSLHNTVHIQQGHHIIHTWLQNPLNANMPPKSQPCCKHPPRKATVRLSKQAVW